MMEDIISLNVATTHSPGPGLEAPALPPLVGEKLTPSFTALVFLLWSAGIELGPGRST